MASFDVAKLLNKITQDIPGIKTVLTALAKWDLSALTDVPDGTMQATTDTQNRLTIKKKVSGSYANVGQLQHSADMVDGYHASASATANTVAVRNDQGALPGNVLGNAATANTATALASGSVLPVNQGGTGGTTASAARTNLGVARGADFTAHVTTAGSPSVTGHVALDALAADGSATAAPGGFGLGRGLTASTDANLCVLNGWYYFTPSTANTPPAVANYVVHVRAMNALNCIQYAHTLSGAFKYSRVQTGGVWKEWSLDVIGITDSISTTSSFLAASATAVKAVNDSAVHTTGNETIAGSKIFTAFPVISRASGEMLQIVNPGIVLGTIPASNQSWQISTRDSGGSAVGRWESVYDNSGQLLTRMWAFNINQSGGQVSAALSVHAQPNGNTFAQCPTPNANATGNQIATAEWVLSHSNAEQVGDIIASFAATRAGCLLMNGGAVSRTTYANLFALIGTAFGAGNGTTTFNLPNARDRVFQGANGNLMQYLAAGLPNITGFFSIRGNQVNTGRSGGAIYKTSGGSVQNSTVEGGRAMDIVNIDASRESSFYGASNTVQSAAITCNFFIKY